MLRDGTLTYVSLFSSAGVGCYGFKQEGYQCIASNELNARRMAVQKANSKCHFNEGYIIGDITESVVKEKIYSEIDKWRRLGNDSVDVLIATPPCQGISVINHKKNKNDIARNSLVVESVHIIKQVQPRFFIFENVQAFQKTICVPNNGEPVRIGEYIEKELGTNYEICARILNFMNYGSNSSRTRTLVIGVNKKYQNFIAPIQLFPAYQTEKTLREVIGGFPKLEWGEISGSDFYHAFRTYRPQMRSWIHDIKEGESAFDNTDPEKRPHHFVNGKRVENARNNRDKYTRQLWDRFPQCITTRNDQLAAQNTIHPEQDRVLSIRELMALMTIPDSFQWVPYQLAELNNMPHEKKREIYKKHELNIRQCIGEAVPTTILRQVASRIRTFLSSRHLGPTETTAVVSTLSNKGKGALRSYISDNPDNLDEASLMRVAELCNAKREENAAYYTNRFITSKISSALPIFTKSHIRILEPSVGAGGFLPVVFKTYEYVPRVTLEVVDIDEDSLDTLKLLLRRMEVPDNFEIIFHRADFLAEKFSQRFDLAIGNPPFSKIKNPSKEVIKALELNVNKNTKDAAAAFLEKCTRISDCVAIVLNKTILSSCEYELTRDMLRSMKIDTVIDFGRSGFSGVSIETMCLIVYPNSAPGKTTVRNTKYNLLLEQKQSYITDKKYPCFLLYRDDSFDTVASKLCFDVFRVFRDRQITKRMTTHTCSPNSIWVIKARNINDDGSGVTHLEGYDVYIDTNTAQKTNAFAYMNRDDVYLTPNMTYNPRVIRNDIGAIPDGSVAVLIPKNKMQLSERQRLFFSTDEYRYFYRVARNLSTQSINVDAVSVFFYGVLKDEQC